MEYQAPGKILLAGEYCVLEGGPAVLAAVDRFVRVEVRMGEPGSAIEMECVLESGVRAVTPIVSACLEALRDAEGIGPPSGMVVRIDSTSLSEFDKAAGPSAKLGLGSSAATAVALLGALTGGRLERSELLLLAEQAHRKAQLGIGSGADIAAAVHGGLLQFRRRGSAAGTVFEVLPFEGTERSGCAGLACWMGQPASTPALVAKVDAWKSSSPGRHGLRMEELKVAAEGMATALRSRDPAGFLSAADSGFRAMVHLDEESGAGLVLQGHRRLASLAGKLGGAAKPTGAGGGDLGLAVFPPGAELERIRSELAAAGLPPVALGIAEQGFSSGGRDSGGPRHLLL